MEVLKNALSVISGQRISFHIQPFLSRDVIANCIVRGKSARCDRGELANAVVEKLNIRPISLYNSVYNQLYGHAWLNAGINLA